MLVEVAVRSPLRKLFTYESETPLERGVRVQVPFRSREVTGIVWAEAKEAPKGLKKILKVFDEKSFFDEKTLKFYERAAQYYGISLGDILGSCLPKKVREGGVIPAYPPKHFVPALPKLSPQQQEVFDQIFATKGFQTHLIFGETGSGKTEIYLHLIEEVLLENAQALFLVPEISLTPQLEDRLAERLGCRVNMFHSQMTESKRLEAFARAFSGEAGVFLGARSALFLPYQKLQLIVVDEEHDPSYKQSERGPYHARDLCLLKSQILDIPVVLGSATPSLESYARVQLEKTPFYRLSPFHEHKGEQSVEIVDLKKTWKEQGHTFISDSLQDALMNSLERGEQALLFLNRRGSASSRVCTSCGSQTNVNIAR